MKNAYILSHNGLGDNITNIGLVNFLLKYYDNIYLLCKDFNKDNVELFFLNKSVTIIPFEPSDEINNCKKILLNTDDTFDDIFVSGSVFMPYFKSRITNSKLLHYIESENNKNDSIIYKEKYSELFLKYTHIFDFYNVFGLNLSIYTNYFFIKSSQISKNYFDSIKCYKIIFLHTLASNRSINLKNIVEKYMNNEEYIIICANENVYNMDNSKYSIANNYVNIKIAYYIDIILNSEIIHVINSCFSCIIYPLILSNKITPLECKIYDV
jgi:hypothetical protein